MAATEILPFAQAGGANVLSQVAYAADSQRTAGNQPGVARAQLANKALLQSSAIAAGIARWMADRQGTNITDQITAATLAGLMQSAFNTALGESLIAAGQTIGASLAAGYQKFPNSLILQWGPGILPNSGARLSSVGVTFPIAFPNAYYLVIPIAVTPGNSGTYWPSFGVFSTSLSGTSVQGDLGAGAVFNQTSIFGYVAVGA